MNININFGNQYYTGGCWSGCWRPRPPVYRPINSNQGNLDGAVVGIRTFAGLVVVENGEILGMGHCEPGEPAGPRY